MSARQTANVVAFPAGSAKDDGELSELVRRVEAILFASAEPVAERDLAGLLPDDTDLQSILERLSSDYAARGVNLVRVAGAWAFRTADDLSFLLQRQTVQTRKLSKAALEVLAIVAYHQPVTRGEIEEIRGVVTSKGTLDLLLETGWVRMRGRRKSPGRPVTYGTTVDFLDHFGLEEVRDLPGLDELSGAGLLQSQLPAGFDVPMPDDGIELTDDEDPFDLDDVEELGLLPPKGGDAE